MVLVGPSSDPRPGADVRPRATPIEALTAIGVETLKDALAVFEQLGAPLWAEQTRAELARIGGRALSRDELTEAERRIAGLVAEGRTNREVAAALFLTEHSVETALTRVYRKLGVRSRAELASHYAAKN